MKRGLVLVLAVVGLFGVAGIGHGAPEGQKLEPAASAASASVAQALYAFSATKAAADRVADTRLFAQRKQIERLQAQGAGVASQLAAEQKSYVAELEKRDRAYAQAVAVFRKAVRDIVSTPQGEAALRRFNAGDEPGALAVLDKLQASRDHAIALAANIERAAGRRRIATLALDARARGKQDTNAVLARYEEVTNLDPGVFWDWIELGRLYHDAGRLLAAREAARAAAQVAKNDWQSCIARLEEGTVAVGQGDLAGARTRYQEAGTLIKRLAAADPSSASLQLGLSVSLDRIGDVLVAQGELASARARFQESLDLRKRLAAANPSSASLQRGVSVSLIKVGDVLVAQGELAAAHACFQESLDLSKRLAAADPSSTSLQRDVSVSLIKVGDMLVVQGELASARARFQESLDLSTRLAAADPSSASLQRDVSVCLKKVGDVLLAQGDLATARARLQEGLDLSTRLAAADPSSASLQRDLWVSVEKVGGVLVAQGELAAARARFQQSLDLSTRLAAADPSSASLQRDVAVSLERVGDVLAAQRELAAACARFQQSLDLRKRLAAADPSSASLQREVLAACGGRHSTEVELYAAQASCQAGPAGHRGTQRSLSCFHSVLIKARNAPIIPVAAPEPGLPTRACLLGVPAPYAARISSPRFCAALSSSSCL